MTTMQSALRPTSLGSCPKRITSGTVLRHASQRTSALSSREQAACAIVAAYPSGQVPACRDFAANRGGNA